MKDYELLQRWTPKTEGDFIEIYRDINDNPDFLECQQFNSIEELVSELEYQGIDFNWLVQLTKNRYGDALEIIEYDSTFYMFLGML